MEIIGEDYAKNLFVIECFEENSDLAKEFLQAMEKSLLDSGKYKEITIKLDYSDSGIYPIYQCFLILLDNEGDSRMVQIARDRGKLCVWKGYNDDVINALEEWNATEPPVSTEGIPHYCGAKEWRISIQQQAHRRRTQY